MKVLLSASEISIERHETYSKQTYRNRCYIYSANGALPLIIPVIKPGGNRSKTKDIVISYTENWQQNHLRALESAYSASPYFLFYRDEIEEIISTKHTRLIDLNHALLIKILDLLDVRKKIEFTESYEKNPVRIEDFRNTFSPKRNSESSFQEYFQVFSNKFGFIPNLSIVDLLFNKGPDSPNYLISNY